MTHTSWEEARAEIGPGHAVILWKDGCGFCEMLLFELAGDDRVTWVDVREDAEANAYVRSVNDGNELTPTVIIGEGVYRNPSASEIRELLA